jgi:hypothetical protein
MQEQIKPIRTPDEVREHIANLINSVTLQDPTGLKKQNLQKLYEEVKEGATNEELTGLLRQANATVFA